MNDASKVGQIEADPFMIANDPTLFFFFFCIFRAAPMGYGSFQAGVQIEPEMQLLAYTTATVTPDP